ncbi:MAG: hypothetical protein ABW250_20465, partial [Pyrinomonadaceae bacterium]
MGVFTGGLWYVYLALGASAAQSQMENSMENKWIKERRGAVVPILAVAMLVIVYGLFQSLYVECNRGIAKCNRFEASYIFTLNRS